MNFFFPDSKKKYPLWRWKVYAVVSFFGIGILLSGARIYATNPVYWAILGLVTIIDLSTFFYQVEKPCSGCKMYRERMYSDFLEVEHALRKITPGHRTPNICIRCEENVGGSVHIFWGGEERRKSLEKALDGPVTLCAYPLTKVPVPKLCSCKRFEFDFDVACPICGKTYADLEKRDEKQ